MHRLLFTAALLLWILSPCPGEDYEGKIVRAVGFRPEKQPLPSQSLRLLVSLQPGERLDPREVRASIERLFATGRYSDIQVLGEADGEGVRITFVTSPAWFVGEVDVEGVPEPPNRQQLVNVSRLQLGEPFDEQQLEAAMEGIRGLLRDNGYYNVSLRTELTRHPDTQSVDIRILADTGERARYAAPSVQMNGPSPISSSQAGAKARWKHWVPFLGWRPVTQQRTDQGLDRILRAFQKKQHLMARVDLERMEYLSDTNRVRPHVQVTPGVPVRVSAEGAKVGRGRLRRLVPVYQERALDRDLAVEGMRNLERYFQSEGYFDAKVDFQIGQDSRGGQELHYVIDRGRRYKVAHVDIRGNRYFDTETIRERLRVTPARLLGDRRGRYSDDLRKEDEESIKFLYRSNGFRDVEVIAWAEDNYRNRPNEVAVYYEIREGRQWYVDSLELSGVDLRLLPTVQSLLTSTEGQPFSEFNIATDRDNLLNFFYNNGYPEASFDYVIELDNENARARLRYLITEGRRNFVRDVILLGLKNTDRELVGERIYLAPGDPLSQTMITTSQRRLYDLGIFAKVDVAVQNPEGRERDKYVLFNLEEGRRYSMNLGFGAEVGRFGGDQTSLRAPAGSSGFSPRLSVGLTRSNLWGLGHTVSLQSRFSNIQRRAILNYFAPQFKGAEALNLTGQALTETSRNINTFTIRRAEGNLQLDQRLSRANRLQYRLTYRRVDLEDVKIDPMLIPILARPTRVAIPSVAFLADRRDDPVDATRGIYTSVEFGYALPAFQGATAYARLLGRNSTYHPVRRDVIFARSTTFGWQRNTAGQEIPLPEKFFGGGASSHRGFPENQAGPRDLITGFPIGGQAMFFNTLELRFPLLGPNVRGVLFQDAGNVYSSMRNFSLRVSQKTPQDFDYLVMAMGFGIRYKTPIGPIRLDVAYAPNSPSFFGYEGTLDDILRGSGKPNVFQRVSRIQFHFSLGQAF